MEMLRRDKISLSIFTFGFASWRSRGVGRTKTTPAATQTRTLVKTKSAMIAITGSGTLRRKGERPWWYFRRSSTVAESRERIIALEIDSRKEGHVLKFITRYLKHSHFITTSLPTTKPHPSSKVSSKYLRWQHSTQIQHPDMLARPPERLCFTCRPLVTPSAEEEQVKQTDNAKKRYHIQ